MKQFLRVATLSLLFSALGCGGALEFFDDFQPRPAVHEDFAGKSFGFDWFPNGNPISAALGEFRIDFLGDPQASGGDLRLTEVGHGEASGTYSWSAPRLTLEVLKSAPGVNLQAGKTVIVVLEADISDGRIRLTNEQTGSSSTSREP